ncbi:hypothetical protein K432DRAFT_169377 [Lepidopterella palustris CBS 459.81]|uniref:Uncharacterized protein n=1 Tax=Lepidopterella palustris CBS 459.81 TaxID=1314670 RepID=A0A8E2JKK4_9PEZI|nr:hypothetical protein K432DRAFT_169377 [Lepidopterella palustris CBS 459.81]
MCSPRREGPDVSVRGPRRPAGEPLTPPQNSESYLFFQSISRSALAALVNTSKQHDPFEANFKLAGEMQAWSSRNRAEFNCDSIMGEIICCYDMLRAPGRIELHFTCETGLIITLEETREIGNWHWREHSDTEPYLDIGIGLRTALLGIPRRSLEY